MASTIQIGSHQLRSPWKILSENDIRSDCINSKETVWSYFFVCNKEILSRRRLHQLLEPSNW